MEAVIIACETVWFQSERIIVDLLVETKKASPRSYGRSISACWQQEKGSTDKEIIGREEVEVH